MAVILQIWRENYPLKRDFSRDENMWIANCFSEDITLSNILRRFFGSKNSDYTSGPSFFLVWNSTMTELSLNCLHVGVTSAGKNVYPVCNTWEESTSSADDIIGENFEGK